MTHFPIEPAMLAEALGVAGFALYVLTYASLTLRVISGDSVTYLMMNFVAASLVLIGLSVSFNLASALIQLFWIAISLCGIALRLTERARGVVPPARG